ncbi:MAG TPA: Ig-like domain-containing protein, partial [Coleofasciculaceae cyanobacterium]
NQLTVATFNVENLDPGDGATKFNALASAIVNNLKSPDIINVEEVQDNNGPTNDSVVDASTTFQTLINAIAAAGGPTYEYRQINPVDDTNGGEPGGNIRVGFLYNPGRVTFVDRPGGTSTSSTTVTDVGNNGTPDLSASPGLIDPTNSAFSSSRKPLVGEFSFNGQTVYVIGNHFNSKGGDQPLFGPNQPPTLNSEVQRTQQATIVKNFVQSILAIDPNANIVVAGDLNDFEFSNPLNLLKSGGLNDLVETLPANERYTYNFQGNAQTLDHILTSNNLLSKLDGFDVVHINSEFADQVSDHDPGVARFNLATLNQAPTAVNFTGATTDLAENTSTATRIKVADIAITDDAQGTNVLSLSGTDANFFEIDSSVLYLKANTALNFEAKSSYAVTVNVDDATVGSTPDASNTLTLAITNVNEAPIANNDSGFTANQSTAKQIPVAALLANDTDPDANTTLSITPNGFSDAVGGSVALNGSNVVFTPDSSFSGTASFKYTVSDGSLTSQATVTLEVGKTINAGNGKDTITGTAGDDILIGGNGKDILIGGAGDDTLMGGNGKDVFVLVGKGNGTDTIQDFTPKQDQIGLSGGLSFGQLSFADVNGSAAIRLGNETLALLTGVNSNQLTPADFVTV